MKNKFIALVIASALVSCGSNDNPEKTADKFLTAFNERKFEDARKVSTPETGKLIDLMENLTKLSDHIDSMPGGKIEIIDHTIDGETAIVRFRESAAPDTQELHLKRIDGRWLVHVTKQDIANKDMPGGTGGNAGIMMDQDSLAVDTIAPGIQ